MPILQPNFVFDHAPMYYGPNFFHPLSTHDNDASSFSDNVQGDPEHTTNTTPTSSSDLPSAITLPSH